MFDTDTEEAFLGTICLRPLDDLPRMVFADWLDEHERGDQAAFIRLQISGDMKGAARVHANRRTMCWFPGQYEAERNAGSFQYGFARSPVIKYTVARGFIDSVGCGRENYRHAAIDLAPRHPIREWGVVRIEEWYTQVDLPQGVLYRLKMPDRSAMRRIMGRDRLERNESFRGERIDAVHFSNLEDSRKSLNDALYSFARCLGGVEYEIPFAGGCRDKKFETFARKPYSGFNAWFEPKSEIKRLEDLVQNAEVRIHQYLLDDDFIYHFNGVLR